MKQTTLFLFSMILLVSCGKKEVASPSAESKIETGIISFSDGWVRPGNAGMMTAAYFTINNGTAVADSLLGLDSNVTGDTQIHETYEEEGGMMGMRPVGLIPVPANSSVKLESGGLHIMIIRPYEDVSVGDSVTFTLGFQMAGVKELVLPVLEEAPN